MKPVLAAAALMLAGCSTAQGGRSSIERYAPDEGLQAAARAGGFRLPFSAGVRVNDVLYLSGMIGTGTDGKLPPGIQAQSRQVMDNIGLALGRAGLSFDDVFKCTVMIEDMKDWPTFNQIYMTYFKEDRLPARSALGADGLALGALVEVECMAHAPARKGGSG